MEKLSLHSILMDTEPESCPNCRNFGVKRVNELSVRLKCQAIVENGVYPIQAINNRRGFKYGWIVLDSWDEMPKYDLDTLSNAIQRMPGTWRTAANCKFFDNMEDDGES